MHLNIRMYSHTCINNFVKSTCCAKHNNPCMKLSPPLSKRFPSRTFHYPSWLFGMNLSAKYDKGRHCFFCLVEDIISSSTKCTYIKPIKPTFVLLFHLDNSHRMGHDLEGLYYRGLYVKDAT